MCSRQLRAPLSLTLCALFNTGFDMTLDAAGKMYCPKVVFAKVWERI